MKISWFYFALRTIEAGLPPCAYVIDLLKPTHRILCLRLLIFPALKQTESDEEDALAVENVFYEL